MKKILILILFISVCFASTTFAKTKTNKTVSSVQLLKSLTDEGKIIREDDVPVEKADVSHDVDRINNLKNLYQEDYNNIDDTKKPDILKYQGVIDK